MDKPFPSKIRKLKDKKSPGLDCVLTEMLKCLSTKFQTGILKLFNLVLNVGYYPDIWNQGLITPIFKSGDKFDPSNYRGILSPKLPYGAQYKSNWILTKLPHL